MVAGEKASLEANQREQARSVVDSVMVNDNIDEVGLVFLMGYRIL
jgi:hypothetical protein